MNEKSIDTDSASEYVTKESLDFEREENFESTYRYSSSHAPSQKRWRSLRNMNRGPVSRYRSDDDNFNIVMACWALLLYYFYFTYRV